MNFKITGCVYEKESGLAVEGLIIRAYDKDMFYDDLLGNACTDEQGKFEIVYSEKEFAELFESKPDIYLSVYAPPCQLLISSKIGELKDVRQIPELYLGICDKIWVETWERGENHGRDKIIKYRKNSGHRGHW